MHSTPFYLQALEEVICSISRPLPIVHDGDGDGDASVYTTSVGPRNYQACRTWVSYQRMRMRMRMSAWINRRRLSQTSSSPSSTRWRFTYVPKLANYDLLDTILPSHPSSLYLKPPQISFHFTAIGLHEVQTDLSGPGYQPVHWKDCEFKQTDRMSGT